MKQLLKVFKLAAQVLRFQVQLEFHPKKLHVIIKLYLGFAVCSYWRKLQHEAMLIQTVPAVSQCKAHQSKNVDSCRNVSRSKILILICSTLVMFERDSSAPKSQSDWHLSAASIIPS